MILPFLLLALDASRAMPGRPAPSPRKPATNLTTCEEFLEGTAFNASSVLDKAWQVFYMWNLIYEEPYQVRFRIPTAALVERFKAEAGNATLAGNWSGAALFMESTMDLSALFLGTPTAGRFQVLTSLVFRFPAAEVLFFAMKVVHPGYLAFMNCQLRVVVALAPLDIFPKEDEVEAAARLLNIRNPHGYPHTVRDPTLEYDPALAPADDDADDEEDAEVQMVNSILD